MCLRSVDFIYVLRRQPGRGMVMVMIQQKTEHGLSTCSRFFKQILLLIIAGIVGKGAVWGDQLDTESQGRSGRY